MDHMDKFVPHGVCILWDRGIVLREILGNGLTMLAYFSIPLALAAIYRRNRPHLSGQLRWGLALFSLFILMCGGGHGWDILTMYVPAYRLESWWKLGTGLVSVATAALMVPELRSWKKREDARER